MLQLLDSASHFLSFQTPELVMLMKSSKSRYPNTFINLLAISCLLFLVAYLIIAFAPSEGPGQFVGVNPGRRVGFLLYCASTLLVSIICAKTRWQAVLFGEARLARWFLSVVFATLLGIEIYYRRENIYAVALGIFFAALVFFRPKILKARATAIVTVVAWLGLMAANLYVLFAVSPNFTRYDQWPDTIVDREFHSAVVIANPADRLAIGLPIFEQVNCAYGVFFQTLLAIYERYCGLLSWGGLIHFIGAVNVLFLVAAACSYFKYAGRRPALACLSALMLVPYLPAFGVITHLPQNSAIRYFGFPLSTLFLLFLAPKLSGMRLGVGAGFVGGICLLINTETGISCCLGLALYLILRSSRLFFPALGQAGAAAGAFLLGLLSALVAFEAAILAGFGYVIPVSLWFARVSSRLYVASSGITSHGDFTADVLPLVVVVHCGYVLAACVGRARDPMEPHNAARVGIAAINLVWLIYYFNSPSPASLTASYFLYLFLFIDLLNSLTLRRLFERRSWLWLRVGLLSVLAVAEIEFLCKVRSVDKEMHIECAPLWQKNHDWQIVSGICLSRHLVGELLTRAGFLKEEKKKSSQVCYLTAAPILMTRLSCVHSDIPVDDIYFTCRRFRKKFQVVENLARRKVKTVLIDAPSLKLQGTESVLTCKDTYRLLLNKYYNMEKTVDGWQVWVLKEAIIHPQDSTLEPRPKQKQFQMQ